MGEVSNHPVLGVPEVASSSLAESTTGIGVRAWFKETDLRSVGVFTTRVQIPSDALWLCSTIG